jgi:hypothetical protein
MPIGSRDRLLRVTATGSELVISTNRSEGGCEAEIAEEGVCFFRYQRLQQLLQGYRETDPEQEHLELEITPEGVRVGQTVIDRAGREVSLFRDPATAPRKWGCGTILLCLFIGWFGFQAISHCSK